MNATTDSTAPDSTASGSTVSDSTAPGSTAPDRTGRLLGLARLLFAVPLIVAPRRMTRMWLGMDRPWLRRVAVGIGIRDVVLGLGLLSGRRPRRPGLLASAAADTADATASTVAALVLRRWRPLWVALVAASGAVTGLRLASAEPG